ncbi:NUDIX hydrolase [Motiliproteus sp. MSK22-1]|uniref:NUDIX hydrolase n=1 Tax=Motiliproteus sp. MSK22-1 TaxID=1897630 RepID=UPI0009782860|nr:NUDIX hydrolase [Motiliproteus sp. MSK22-1]OMH35308.1 ADP-ribose pyrophosphatase [Motiliproteus sp. MSK22-1]
MNFCCQCGSKVCIKVPDGDNLPRHVCVNCNYIHYQNPKVVAGCLASYEDKVLLCKRAIEPQRGLWTLPAGFMENGESTRQAALRETQEEACAEVEIHDLYTLTSIKHISQIQMIYRATLNHPIYGAGEETLETRLFAEQDIPWQQLAFQTIEQALKFFFEDRKTGDYPIRHVDLDRSTSQRTHLNNKLK